MKNFTLWPVRLLLLAGMALPQSPSFKTYMNPATTIPFYIPHRQLVQIKLYDLLGNEMAILPDRIMEQGHHTIELTRNGLASGIYFYRMQGDGFIQTRKLILVH